MWSQSIWADVGTAAAGYTFMRIIKQFMLFRPGLRIGTPSAAQRTSGQKDCGPDAVAVVDGVILHLDDGSPVQ